MQDSSNKKFAIIVILLIAGIVIGLYYATAARTPKTPDEKHQDQIENSMANENETKNVDMISDRNLLSVTSEPIKYYGETAGYLAMPEEAGDYPGIIMIHEWWGLNDNIRSMADKLAGQGYVVLAVDLYNGQVATESSDAGTYAGAVRENPEEAINNMKAAVAYLKEQQNVNKIGSLGWCFGGQQSLQISLNEDLDTTVIYYGNLITDKEQLASIDHPVLGIFGSEDQSIPVETVNEFDAALDELGIENQIEIYDGVGHAFANPSGANYAPEETEDAWMKTIEFLEKALKN